MVVVVPTSFVAPWHAFLGNRNLVVGTLTVRRSVAATDPGEARIVVVDPRAFTALGDALRAAGYDNTAAAGPLARLALGFTVDRDDVAASVPDPVLACLCESGLAEELGPAIRLRGAILAAGSLLAYVPRDRARPDLVYMGPDTAYLVDAVQRLGPVAPAGPAADLGTGTGVVAAALAADHPVVVASDVSARSARTALLTAALNRFPAGHRVRACVSDVGHGLRAASFGLVAANTPWVPSGGASRPRLFADGGPTGFELPRRFLTEGAALLQPGGVLIALAADVTFVGGRSPLRELCLGLDDAGFTTTVVPTGMGRTGETLKRTVRSRMSGVADAEHVAVVVARHPVPSDLDGMVAEMADAWTGQPVLAHAGR